MHAVDTNQMVQHSLVRMPRHFIAPRVDLGSQYRMWRKEVLEEHFQRGITSANDSIGAYTAALLPRPDVSRKKELTVSANKSRPTSGNLQGGR